MEECDDELVASIYAAAQDSKAREVFVEILTSDAGKTPDEFMDQINCPIQFVWGI